MHVYDFSGEYFQQSVEFTTKTVIHVHYALSSQQLKVKVQKVFTENMSLRQ